MPGGTDMDWRPVLLSLEVGAWTTAISIVVGGLLGWILSHGRVPGRRAVESMVLLPLVLPPTVLGYFLLVVIGRRSPFGQAWEAVLGEPLVFTKTAAILAACASAVPIVARQLSAAFSLTPPDVIEAARLDGATGISLLVRVILPQVREPLMAAAAIAFSRAVGDFGATLMVAGSIPGETQTAAIAIYDLVNAGREGEALAMVAIVSLIALVVLVVTGSGGKREGA